MAQRQRLAVSHILVLTILLCAAVSRGSDHENNVSLDLTDVFSETVSDAGVSPSELGYRPNKTWPRFPHDPPGKLPFFDDLWADARSSYPFARTLGNTVEDLLDPALLADPRPGEPGALYRLAVQLSYDRRIGGIRGLGTKLYEPQPVAKDPLVRALHDLTVAAGKPRSSMSLRRETNRIPKQLHLPLAKLVLQMITARTWIDRGLRNVPTRLQTTIWKNMPRMLELIADDERYDPELDDAQRLIDEHSLAYGTLIALEALHRARADLADIEPPPGGFAPFELHLATPWGTILIDNRMQQKKPANDPFLIVRMYPQGPTYGPLGATSPGHPLSVALLFETPGTISAPNNDRIASGILGAGLVLATGKHDNRWQAGRYSFGAGLLGTGILADEGGNDTYTSATGQGAGVRGSGLLLDAAGNDCYTLTEGDGQGFGGPSGIGMLADRSGNDRYYAEPDARKAGKNRADYHSENKVAQSSAQGAGYGRRGDVSDGHAYAGGLGALLDVEGDDTYTAGNGSQAFGYWFGTGILWDGGGNDGYRSTYFSQGSGAHFAVAALIDEGGDDDYALKDFVPLGLGRTSGAGLGFGWDMTNALFLDRAGNDRYEAQMMAIGCGHERSHAWFIDEGGDDRYQLDAGTLGFGMIDQLPKYLAPRLTLHPFMAAQTGWFFDLGGTDTYLRWKNGTTAPDDHAGDDRFWKTDGARNPGAGVNAARGLDSDSGRIGWLDAWPHR